MDGQNTTRPAVLDSASETQIQELERQYAEGDHDAWNTLGQSYGWSEQDVNAVWQWFGERPDEGQSQGTNG